MFQLAFFSIVLNGITGFLFIFGDTGENDSAEKKIKPSFSNGGGRLILGIISVLVGILKLFLPYRGIAVLGDLVPALAGIVGGFTLLFGFYRENSTRFDKGTLLDRVGDTFLRYRKVAGFVLAGIALLHLFFPTALFL